MSNIVPFMFKDNEVRAITGEDGSIWLVAKDVCDCLGLSGDPGQHTRALDDDEKGLITIQTPGGPQDMVVISEPGLYKLTFKSRKPEAKVFTKWVTSDVLPAIRKTGVYVAPQADDKPLKKLAEDAKAAAAIAKAMGLTGNAAVIGANQLMRKVTGFNCLEALGATHLLSETQRRVITPTDLGKFLGDFSAMRVNQELERAGFQTKGPDGKWRPTDKGREYAVLVDTGKHRGSGTPIQQLKWDEGVLPALKAYLEDPFAEFAVN